MAPQHPFQSRLAWGLYYGTIPKGYRAEKEDADPVGLEWDKCVVADDDGEERSPANDMGGPGRLMGADSPGHSGDGPSQDYRAQGRSPWENLGRNHVPLLSNPGALRQEGI